MEANFQASEICTLGCSGLPYTPRELRPQAGNPASRRPTRSRSASSSRRRYRSPRPVPSVLRTRCRVARPAASESLHERLGALPRLFDAPRMRAGRRAPSHVARVASRGLRAFRDEPVRRGGMLAQASPVREAKRYMGLPAPAHHQHQRRAAGGGQTDYGQIPRGLSGHDGDKGGRSGTGRSGFSIPLSSRLAGRGLPK